MNPFGVQPTIADFQAGRVTNPNQSEVTRSPLYDFLLYPTAGQLSFNFFAQPQGAAGSITSAVGAQVGSPKTKFDTNLQMANTLPSGKAFNIVSIELLFFPGASAAPNTYTPAAPAQANAGAAVADLLARVQAANDVNTVLQAGCLELQVLDKIYVQETPLLRFPPQTGISLDMAVASNATGTGITSGVVAKAIGRAWIFDQPFLLQPSMNFAINVTFPGLVPTPSGFNGRIGVILDGYYARATQ